MKRVATILAAMLLAACGGQAATTEMARYDFGSPGDGTGPRLPVAAVEVQAASWLSGPAMYFRLVSAEPQRRRSYAESRWAAPPAELLEAFLKRRIMFAQPDLSGSGCRLQLVLDELEQRFDDPQSSRMVLEIHALLSPLRGVGTVSKRAFTVQRPAAAPDARGGAAAARDAAQGLADQLGRWLDEIAREKPAIVELCRS